MSLERAASRTAVLVCQGRGAAHGRLAQGRFSDPVAAELLRPEELAVVEQVRAAAVPDGWAPRLAYESVAACAEIIVPRTVAIDDAVRASPHPQLVIVGAGLDSRSWRMPELAQTDVIEVDHPASQRDKRERAGDLPTLARTHRFQPADLAVQDLGAALDEAGHRREVPTTWLWEGVVPYLRRRDVIATLHTLGARSAPGSTLIVNYQTPSLRARAGRVLNDALTRLGRTDTITAGEPWRTLLAPARAAALLADAGFVVHTDEDLLTIAERLGLTPTRSTSLGNGRVAVATRR